MTRNVIVVEDLTDNGGDPGLEKDVVVFISILHGGWNLILIDQDTDIPNLVELIEMGVTHCLEELIKYNRKGKPSCIQNFSGEQLYSSIAGNNFRGLILVSDQAPNLKLLYGQKIWLWLRLTLDFDYQL